MSRRKRPDRFPGWRADLAQGGNLASENATALAVRFPDGRTARDCDVIIAKALTRCNTPSRLMD